MRLSPRLSIGSSRQPNHFSRRLASRHLALLVVLVLAVAAVVVFVDRSRAGGGDLDTTFNQGGAGANDLVRAVALQPDGKIVIGGDFTSYNGDAATSHGVMRLNADGTRDTTFNPGGVGAGAQEFVMAVALQPDGKIVIGGNFTGYNGDAAASDYVMRLNADGTRDTTFNVGGTGANSLVFAVAVRPDGKIVIGGAFTSYNGDAAASDRVMRLNADGTRDPTFNAGGVGAKWPGRGNPSVITVAMQPDGKIVIGGAFTSYNGDTAASDCVMRLNADGTRDTTFNAGGVGAGVSLISVSAVALQPNGKIVIGGSFTSYNGDAAASDRVMRLNADGTRDAAFNPGGAGASEVVEVVAVQSDGKIIIGGYFTSYNGDTAANHGVMLLNADGTRDTTFNAGSVGADGNGYAVAVQPDGKIVIGGDFTSYNGDATASDKVMRLFAVNPNHAPSFVKGTNQTVNEDAAAQTINNWATAISPGPDESEAGQTLTFQVTDNTNAALFSGGPAISETGTLTYTPAANASGAATITVNLKDNDGTANGGLDTSAAQSFTITVNSVNDAPSFTKGIDHTVNEDAGAQSVANWATAISCGPADESAQTLTFQVTNNTNAALFSSGPAINSTGTLTYTPVANTNGSATITVNLKDSGGTANGGVNTSATQSFTITVNPVNDVPVFTKGANQTVNEDTGAQTVNSWATAISAGPADESGQTLTFQVTGNTNAALFSAGPAISSSGLLTYTPAADANGTATLTINLKDSGGTANGGVDTSASETFPITVNSVNDVPSFTKGADQTVNNNAAQSVANWATAISAGPANESAQILTFQITNNTNTGLFSSGPAISSTGTLTYTPASNAGGTATITVNLKDNAGTANGGVDTSASQTFTITVTPVGGFFNFSAASYNTTESSGLATVTVKRTGDLTQSVTVDYASSGNNGLPCSTANGVATPKCDFTTPLGTLSFATGEDTKNVDILISQDNFVEGSETFTVTLSNPTGNAALGATSTSTTTIADDATEPPSNPIDDARNFVRQHYHDFLSREPDQAGWDFWTNQITSCGSNAQCTEVRRVDVSASFFLSIEFQQTGYFVERFYKTGYGDAAGTSQFQFNHQLPVPIVRFNEFLKDTQRIGQGVVVLQPGWEQVLENNKLAYAVEFVQTSRFITALPTTLTPDQFVDRLNQNAGGVMTLSERSVVINLFGSAANTSNVTARAQAVRLVADDTDLYNAEFNRAFVLAEYYGYLRRNPNDAPETTLDYTGYDFWLTKLNQFNGNYINAEMVKAFLSSIEYRQRFGP